jgi:hypothetical protein
VKHVFVKAAARVNNRAENSHQPTRERERRMRGFHDPKRTQAFLSCFGPMRQHFVLKRHLLPQNAAKAGWPEGSPPVFAPPRAVRQRAGPFFCPCSMVITRTGGSKLSANFYHRSRSHKAHRFYK